MFRILIIDDSCEKIGRIKEVLSEIAELDVNKIETSSDIETARMKLSKKQYDLILLDLYIPESYGSTPNPDNAASFLGYLKIEDDIFKPYFVIGVTKYKDIPQPNRYDFEKHLYHILDYDEMADDWKIKLKSKVEYLISIEDKIKYSKQYDYDVAFITALQFPEFAEILKLGEQKWQEYKNVLNDKTTTYYINTFKNSRGRNIRCVAAHSDQMGMCASATLTSKLIYTFRPKYIIMTGICAATSKDIHYGDIIVASEAWNGASGKIKDIKDKGKLFLPDYRHEVLNAEIVNCINKLKTNERLFFDICSRYPTSNGKPPFTLKVHCGPVASMPAVIQSKDEVEKLKEHCRKLIGLEMEGYGVYYAANHTIEPKPTFISIKSASDYADIEKDDDYQEYCAYSSAQFAYYLIINELDFDL